MRLAREMMAVMRAADNFDAVMPTIMQAMKPAITRGEAKATKDRDEISPAILQEFAAAKDGLLDDIAAIYANTFRAAELGRFVAFYKMPAGEKLARLSRRWRPGRRSGSRSPHVWRPGCRRSSASAATRSEASPGLETRPAGIFP